MHNSDTGEVGFGFCGGGKDNENNSAVLVKLSKIFTTHHLMEWCLLIICAVLELLPSDGLEIQHPGM